MGDSFRNGRVHVSSEKCSTCVYRPGNPMFLPPGHLKKMVQANLERDAAFACHQTLEYGGYEVDGNAVCRGFFDAHKEDVTALRMAEEWDILRFQDPPTERKRDMDHA